MNSLRKITVVFDADGRFPMHWMLELSEDQITELKYGIQQDVEQIRSMILEDEPIL